MQGQQVRYFLPTTTILLSTLASSLVEILQQQPASYISRIESSSYSTLLYSPNRASSRVVQQRATLYSSQQQLLFSSSQQLYYQLEQQHISRFQRQEHNIYISTLYTAGQLSQSTPPKIIDHRWQMATIRFFIPRFRKSEKVIGKHAMLPYQATSTIIWCIALASSSGQLRWPAIHSCGAVYQREHG